MKVLYDYQAFTIQHFGGVSKCFCELIANLPNDVKAEIAIRQSNNVHLQQHRLVDDLKPATLDEIIFTNRLNIKGIHRLYNFLSNLGIIRGAEWINRQASIKSLKNSDYDVFHSTYFDPYFLKYIGNKPWVITVHDMMPELFPQYYKKNDIQRMFKRKYLQSASAIVAVSETTKKDIVKLLGIQPEKIKVIYHGGPIKEVITEKSMIDSPYFLYVGVRSSYKNFTQTVLDFSKFSKKYGKVKLVCTGSEFTENEKRLFHQCGIGESVVHLKVSDIELKSLYAHAIAFIYPSLYEGFGMPILEAYAYGCPVMLNDIEVFHEIAGHAAIYFKSFNGSSNLSFLLEKMYKINGNVRKELINKGYTQLLKYSWKRSAEQLADLYKSVLKSSSFNL